MLCLHVANYEAMNLITFLPLCSKGTVSPVFTRHRRDDPVADERCRDVRAAWNCSRALQTAVHCRPAEGGAGRTVEAKEKQSRSVWSLSRNHWISD